MSETAYARQRRDQRTADAAAGDDRSLMCSAHGCPNRWSVDIGRRMCSAHYHADPIEWPSVTEQQLWAETDRAAANAFPPSPVAPLTLEQKQEVLARMQEMGRRLPESLKAWAYRLRDREQAGEKLTLFQREAWRGVIGSVS